MTVRFYFAQREVENVPCFCWKSNRNLVICSEFLYLIELACSIIESYETKPTASFKNKEVRKLDRFARHSFFFYMKKYRLRIFKYFNPFICASIRYDHKKI